MKTKNFKNVNYIGWVVIILAFLFFYFSYFFIYIPKKEAIIQQKGFRILNEYGSNMLEKHKYFENHFRNYGIYYSIKSLAGSAGIKKREVNIVNVNKNKEIDRVLNGLQNYVSTTAKSVDSSYFYDKNEKKLFLSFNYQNNDPELVTTLSEFYESSTTNTKLETMLNDEFSHNVPIADFMQNLKFDELFEKIILFNTDEVWYNTKLGSLTEITNPKALCDSANNQQSGIYKVLNISGKDKHIMVLPISFAGGKFYIAGFISDLDYQNKTRTINKQLLIFIAAILLLVFAGMPILKIFFIDDRERLKASDATSSGISLLFGIGLFILLIIAFSKKQVVDSTNQHSRIHLISDSLYSNVMHDIESIKTLGKSIVQGKMTEDTLANMVLSAFNSNVAFTQHELLCSPFSLNEIILIDNNGIVRKGYTSTPFSDIVKVNLSERKYFQNVKSINNSWPTSAGLNFYMESIKSFNTAQYETAISFRKTSTELPVLAITSKIPSLYEQVLPNDIEFVIIDKTGRVLYHSIQEKNLQENFVLECESDLKLMNAINSRIEAETFVNYNEKKWLARIIPIKDTPLYHVTLLDINQADNKNARIILITFYFLIASLVFMIVGLLIIRWITRSHNEKHKNTWFLNWLVLQPRKYLIYKKISAILTVIIAVQLLGFWFASNPVALFVYEFIFIVFSFFVAMIFLNRAESIQKEPVWDEFLNEILVLLATLLAVFCFISLRELAWKQLIPLAILVAIIIFTFQFFKNDEIGKLINDSPKDIPDFKIKRAYLVFLFLFLTSISGVPVVEYYFKVKDHEGKLWQREQLLKVGNENIALQSDYMQTNSDWYKRLQGNGLDNLKITLTEFTGDFDTAPSGSIEDSSFAVQVYHMLPDPVTTWYNQPKLLAKKEYVVSKFKNDTLFFKKGMQTGAITVEYLKHKPLFPVINYVVLILFVLLVIVLSIWFLLKYLAKVLLNLNREKPSNSDVKWSDVLETNGHERILLNSFNGSDYLERTRNFLDTYSKSNEIIKTIQASEIIDQGFNSAQEFNGSETIIWIGGFHQIVNEIEKHDNLLSFLIKLSQTSRARIIVDLSFDIELIFEFYDDYINSNELEPKQMTQLFLLRKKWAGLFDGYFSFNGYINQKTMVKSEHIRVEDDYFLENNNTGIDLQFTNIWNNLTSYEKIVLFDLADDGLLNRKNKVMIQKLIDKRLIVTDPAPAFYDDKFRDFVAKSLKSNEVKSIESKLGLKGSWHNAKYLILLILVPLAAFVIISQGISIEKVFGIFAGGLAIVTGIIRLFDSTAFKWS